jgi:type III secretion protein F
MAPELNTGTLVATTGSQVSQAEATLNAQLQSLSGKKDISQTEMLQMQMNMQKWTMTMQMQSTLVKEFGDALKGIVQKMG